MAETTTQTIHDIIDSFPTRNYKLPTFRKYTDRSIAERAKFALDGWVEWGVLTYHTQEEYDAALAKLTKEFGG